MSFQKRAAFAFALLITLISSITAFAKGGFDFIAITGLGLKEEVRIADAALTEDFFTFANFYENKTKEPANPGAGYDIIRYYVDGSREIPFDRLHYYPETGFVFYDGIENGESEYDGGWYTANPEIKAVFETAIAAQVKSVAPVEEKQIMTSASPLVKSGSQTLPILTIAIAAGLAALFIFAFWRRKPFVR